MNEKQWDQYMHNMLESDDNRMLPQTVRQRIDETLASLSELPINQLAKKRNRLTRWVTSVAGVLLVITLSFSYLSPAVAKYLSQLPVIGSAFEWAGDVGVKSFVKNHSLESIGQTAEDQGIAITLDQVIYDGIRLTIGLIHEDGLILDTTYPNKWIKANGMDINAGRAGARKQIPGGLMATVYNYDPVDSLPDEFEFTFIIDEVQIVINGQTKRIRGKWQFSTHVSKITEGVVTRSFNPPLTKSFEGTTISITQVTLTPITTLVKFDLIESEKFQQHRKFTEIIPEYFVINHLGYELMNEQGIYLEPLSGSRNWVINSGIAAHSSAVFAPLTSASKVLTFQPVQSSHPMRKVDDRSYVGAFEPRINYRDLPSDFPITIQQGEAGHITFNRIDYSAEQTWVEFEVIGNSPNNQKSAWWIENEQGERYEFNSYDQIRISEHNYAFRTKLPPIDPNAKLRIAAVEIQAPDVLKELEFQIPLE